MVTFICLIQKPLKICGFLLPWMLQKNCFNILNVLFWLLIVLINALILSQVHMCVYMDVLYVCLY